MKVISMNNQQSQNRPVAFKNIEKIMVGTSNRKGNIVSMVFQLTGTDFTKQQSLLRTFRHSALPNDVLQIGVRGYDGQASTIPTISVNHQDVYGNGPTDKRFIDSISALRAVVSRIAKAQNPNLAKLAERRQFRPLLSGEGFAFEPAETPDGVFDAHKAVRLISEFLDAVQI